MMGVLNHLSTLLLLSLLPPALSGVNRFDPECQEFFLEGTNPNLPGILVGGTVQNQNRYKPICQLFKNIYRFATLYDTTNKIPVFSAYTFTGPPTDCRPSQSWMIEPQLENENVKLNGKLNMKCCKVVNNQAADTDYYKNGMGLHRGHLFPCSYAPDDDTMMSTFTLTNAVPQERSFNQGSWKTMEGRVREALVKNCKDNNKIKAYVVTGAVPSNNIQLNNRVNIPDLMWTAYCCYNSEKDKWMAGAHWGENKEKRNTKVLEPHSLADLNVMLNQYYHVDGVVVGDVKVFPDQCSNGVIPTELLKGKNKVIRVSQKTKTKTNSKRKLNGGVQVKPKKVQKKSRNKNNGVQRSKINK
ncbi:endonuclease domain-containing 1 protein-like [Oncorhynchus keta]|uniref:endonuclease domain-containing 1 protein-like n=1 Tax=Oncorhynchus keta TaxID=8018 RepID=UPI0015F8206D|nr:endonuclease domain-containing 1 protein-like [Oncorhynchus keta]